MDKKFPNQQNPQDLIRRSQVQPPPPPEPMRPVPVSLPPHLFYPPDALTLDIATVATFQPGDSGTLINFVCPNGLTTYLLSYAIFNNGLLASDFLFLPTINGTRIYPYHGDPLQNFKIYLGLGADLSDNNLRQGYAVLNPGQTLNWKAFNNSGVATTMGVRVVGYLTAGQARSLSRLGG